MKLMPLSRKCGIYRARRIATFCDTAPDTPLRRMSIAMLLRCIKDCTPDHRGERAHDTTVDDEADAIRWLYDDDEGFLSALAVCERVGLTVKVVRDYVETN